jgi:hypothetical protein
VIYTEKMLVRIASVTISEPTARVGLFLKNCVNRITGCIIFHSFSGT